MSEKTVYDLGREAENALRAYKEKVSEIIEDSRMMGDRLVNLEARIEDLLDLRDDLATEIVELRGPEPEIETFTAYDGDGNPVTQHTVVKEKPPLGLRPRWFATRDRYREVLDAIARYESAGWTVPPEWIEERDQLDADQITQLPPEKYL